MRGLFFVVLLQLSVKEACQSMLQVEDQYLLVG
jgi:hypothetical protein